MEHSTTPADLTSVRGHPVESSDVPGDDIRAGVADPKTLRRMPTDAEHKFTAQVLRNDKAIVVAKGWKRRHVVRKKTLPVSPSAETRLMKIGEKAHRVTAVGDRKMPGGTTDSAHDQNKKSRKREADRGQVRCAKGGSKTD